MTKPSIRKNQCKACPWKKNTNPRDIPNGYCPTKHANLRSTIAKPGDISNVGRGGLHLMACHESDVGKEQPCVGWLSHQLGPGNNIALRFMALDGRFNGLKLDGPQHRTFEATLGKDDDGIDWGDDVEDNLYGEEEDEVEDNLWGEED